MTHYSHHKTALQLQYRCWYCVIIWECLHNLVPKTPSNLSSAELWARAAPPMHCQPPPLWFLPCCGFVSAFAVSFSALGRRRKKQFASDPRFLFFICSIIVLESNGSLGPYKIQKALPVALLPGTFKKLTSCMSCLWPKNKAQKLTWFSKMFLWNV